MLRYKFRFNPFLREALYIGLFYEYWRKRESIIRYNDAQNKGINLLVY